MPSAGLPDAPSAVDGLYQFLRSRGFVVVEDRQDEAGGRRVVLRGRAEPSGGPDGDVEIRAERTGWSIGLRFEGMASFVDARLWMAHVDGAPLDDPALSDQATWVAARLVDAAAAAPALAESLLEPGHEHDRGHATG